MAVIAVIKVVSRNSTIINAVAEVTMVQPHRIKESYRIFDFGSLLYAARTYA